MINPTNVVSEAMTTAYDHFNKSLFDGKLPYCIIHMHRKSKCYGYFAGERFGNESSFKTDEIALNPSHFKARTAKDSLSTLAHEMAHLWQHHFGKRTRAGYHDKEWAVAMKKIGLHPSNSGKPGGKETGQKMSHYIIDGGAFDMSCQALLATGFTLPYVELWTADKATAKKKAASKTKYTCPDCGINAWAKEGLALRCTPCDVDLEVMNPTRL